jgi:hypothetical protein
MKIYEKKISNEVFKKYSGKNFGESYYDYIIDSSSDGYYLDSLGSVKVLFKFRKKVIIQSLQNIAITTFLQESKKKHSNRGIAAGVDSNGNARHTTATGQNEGKYIASNISGYFDRPLREHRGILGTIKACRTTAFTLRNQNLWNSGLSFIQRCSKLYKLYSPKEYLVQKREWNRVIPELRIPKTVFTTITSNYNWRTACHCDSGDFSGGLGNLIVVGKNFTGGYLGFPQFKVLIKIQPGDFLLMDVHQYHCNTPLKVSKDGYRLSFVMYIRQDMSKCNNIKTIGTINYYYSKNNSL